MGAKQKRESAHIYPRPAHSTLWSAEREREREMPAQTLSLDALSPSGVAAAAESFRRDGFVALLPDPSTGHPLNPPAAPSQSIVNSRDESAGHRGYNGWAVDYGRVVGAIWGEYGAHVSKALVSESVRVSVP